MYATFKQFPTNEFSTITSMFIYILTRFPFYFKIYNILGINVVIFLNIRVLIAPNPFGSRFVTSKCENYFKKSIYSYQWIYNVLLVLLGVCLMLSNLLLCVICHLLNSATILFWLLSLPWMLFLLGEFSLLLHMFQKLVDISQQ